MEEGRERGGIWRILPDVLKKIKKKKMKMGFPDDR